jgi:hypothetical protein
MQTAGAKAADGVADVLHQHGETPFFLAQPGCMDDGAGAAEDEGEADASRHQRPVHVVCLVVELRLPFAGPVVAERHRSDRAAYADEHAAEGEHG